MLSDKFSVVQIATVLSLSGNNTFEGSIVDPGARLVIDSGDAIQNVGRIDIGGPVYFRSRAQVCDTRGEWGC